MASHPQAGNFQLDSKLESTDEAKSEALINVCAYANDADDANLLIDMLGLRQTLEDNYQRNEM